MALTKTIQATNNFGESSTLVDAYIKVTRVIGNKELITATTEVLSNNQERFYYTEAYEFKPDMDGSNFIKQAYNYLKTLPEFANATDC